MNATYCTRFFSKKVPTFSYAFLSFVLCTIYVVVSCQLQKTQLTFHFFLVFCISVDLKASCPLAILIDWAYT